MKGASGEMKESGELNGKRIPVRLHEKRMKENCTDSKGNGNEGMERDELKKERLG